MRELLSVSIFLAEKGGKELVRIFDSGALKTQEKTGKNDLVTRGDHARLDFKIFAKFEFWMSFEVDQSHEIMYFGMRKAFDRIHVVSEEESEENHAVNFEIEYRYVTFH